MDTNKLALVKGKMSQLKPVIIGIVVGVVATVAVMAVVELAQENPEAATTIVENTIPPELV